MQHLTIGGVVVRIRPHIGCGCAPHLYQIMDGDQVVRAQISRPGADDCREAVRVHRQQLAQAAAAQHEAASKRPLRGITQRRQAARKARGEVTA